MKNWDWRVNIAANIGGKEFYDSKARRSVATELKNVPAYWANSWTIENPDAKFPRYDDPAIGVESDYWAVNGTMIRINDMTLSYTAPQKAAKIEVTDAAGKALQSNTSWDESS